MKKRGWDPATETFAQCWFQPSCPPGMEGEAVLEVHQGECLHVDELVALEARPLQERRVYSDERPSDGGVAQWWKIAAALAAHGFPLSHDVPGVEARTTCPHCEDPSPSLCLRASGERVVLHCHASCTAAQVLGAIGLRTADLYSELSHRARRAEAMALGSKLELPPDPVPVAFLPTPQPIPPLPLRGPLAPPPARPELASPPPARGPLPALPQHGVTQ